MNLQTQPPKAPRQRISRHDRAWHNRHVTFADLRRVVHDAAHRERPGLGEASPYRQDGGDPILCRLVDAVAGAQERLPRRDLLFNRLAARVRRLGGGLNWLDPVEAFRRREPLRLPQKESERMTADTDAPAPCESRPMWRTDEQLGEVEAMIGALAVLRESVGQIALPEDGDQKARNALCAVCDALEKAVSDLAAAYDADLAELRR